MFKVFRKYGMFLIVPGIVLVFSVLLKLVSGPYWLATNYDPPYLELVNGLRILKGVPMSTMRPIPGHRYKSLCCTVVLALLNIGPLRGFRKY